MTQHPQNYDTPRRDPVNGNTPDPVTGNGFGNHAEGNLDGLFGHEPLVICRLKAKWSRILQDERKKQVLLSLWRSPHRKSFADLARDVGTNRKQIRRWIYGDRRHRTVFDYLINYPEPRQGKPAEIGLTGLGKRFALWLEAGHTPTEEELEELAWIVLRYYYRTGKSPRAVAARQRARHQRGSNQPSNCSHPVATLYPHCGHTVATSVSVSVSETKDLNKSGNSVTENGNERANDMPVRGRNERQGNDLWLGLDGLGTELAHKRTSDLTRLGDLLPYKPAPPRPDPAPQSTETKPPEGERPSQPAPEDEPTGNARQTTITQRPSGKEATKATDADGRRRKGRPTKPQGSRPTEQPDKGAREAEQRKGKAEGSRPTGERAKGSEADGLGRANQTNMSSLTQKGDEPDQQGSGLA